MRYKRLFAFTVILLAAYGSRIQTNLLAQLQPVEAGAAAQSEEQEKYADSLLRVDTKSNVELKGTRDEISVDPLLACQGRVEPADYLTFELGGYDFQAKSHVLSKTAKEMQLKSKVEYGWEQIPNFYKYGKNFDYEQLPYEAPSTAKTKIEIAWQHLANGLTTASRAVADAGINMAKGTSDVAINAGKGVADALMNSKTQIARGFVLTGAQISAKYSSERQTTDRTQETRWTHSDIAVGDNYITSAPGERPRNLCKDSLPDWTGKVIRSRFIGKPSLNIGNISNRSVRDEYKKLATKRALMWEPYLKTPAATIVEWHRVIFGKCLSVKDAGDSDYFQAVTNEKVKEMWEYEPSAGENEKAFLESVMNKFRTHDQNGSVKPKAMFSSKFTSAVWSSVIGNPSSDPNANVRQADVNQMFPFNPGSCAPWTIVRWMLGEEGKNYWDSCIIDPTKLGPPDQAITEPMNPCI